MARLQGEMADRGGHDSLAPELWVTLADEIVGDRDEAAGSVMIMMVGQKVVLRRRTYPM